VSNRIFRLAIVPDGASEVRRVIDFDGRHSLHDVHCMMHRTLKIADDDHLYAFFLSGRYWDTASKYVDPRADGPRADKALLFRLRLRAGQEFVYLFDFGSEQRFSLTVVSVTETDAPLASPVVIESVGDAPAIHDESDFDDDSDDDGTVADDSDDDDIADGSDDSDTALEEQVQAATALLKQVNEFDGLEADEDSETIRACSRRLAEAGLTFVLGLNANLALLSAVDRALDFELYDPLLGLPARLYEASETELSVRVAEALLFCAPDVMNGEIALAYAHAGDRERALAKVLSNLGTAEEAFVAECKAGDVYRQLGEADSAEVYYRRALAIAETGTDRREATLLITSLMVDTGREKDADRFLAEQIAAERLPAKVDRLPTVGRNEPCPCGSGKKYKKCHGV